MPINSIEKISDVFCLPNDQLSVIFSHVEELIRESKNVQFFDKGWVIALISSFSTAAVYLAINSISYFYKQVQLKKHITLNLYTEISTIVIKINKGRNRRKEAIIDFKQKAEVNDFSSGHPSLIGARDSSDEYYKTHLGNLSLLKRGKNDDLFVKVKLFYDAVNDYYVNSEIISKSFEGYYNNNPMVGYMDIVSRANGQDNDAGLIILKGYDILAKLLLKYKVDNASSSRKEKQETIKKIKEIKNEEINDVKKMADDLQVSLITFIYYILKLKLYKNGSRTGSYVKIKK